MTTSWQPTRNRDVVVVGSANLDVVLGVEVLARPGETVLARSREDGPGGKGLNQAVAAARSGAPTALVAVVGADPAGELLRQALVGAGVIVDGLRTGRAATGTAYVVVDARGENAIVVDPGANAELGVLSGPERALVARAAVLLCQLEVGLEAVRSALGAARGLRVLNAAPARPLDAALLATVDVLVVNEQEALAVAGGATTVEQAVQVLGRQVPEVVVTLGARGLLLAERGRGTTAVPGVPARQVVDTTGAGDTFCGALAAARAAGLGPVEAARLACVAASLSVERPGAARAAPTGEQVRLRSADLG